MAIPAWISFSNGSSKTGAGSCRNREQSGLRRAMLREYLAGGCRPPELLKFLNSFLKQVVVAVEDYRRSGSEHVQKVRSEREYCEQVLKKWQEAKDKIGATVTPTGLRLPRLALPDLDEAGEIARFMWDEGLPGEFPFLTDAYPVQ